MGLFPVLYGLAQPSSGQFEVQLHGSRLLAGRLHGVGPEPLRILYVFAADSFSDVEYVFPD